MFKYEVVLMDHLRLTVRISGVDQCVIDRRALYSAVVDPVSGTDTGAAVAEQVVSKTDAWTKVIRVTRKCRGRFRNRPSIPWNDLGARVRKLRIGHLDV